jgi:hypothetical protein
MAEELMDVRKIWDGAAHNAFTDLIRFNGVWFCVFRESDNHISPEGKIRIIASDDGAIWDSRSIVSMPGVDLRDPKISITPAGKLMLNAAGAYDSSAPQRHQSFVWFSSDGVDWSDPVPIGDPNCWIWRVRWNRGKAYGVGYKTVEPLGTRLYASDEGSRFDPLVDRLFVEHVPNESTMAFQEDGVALCLIRRDGKIATAMLGRSEPDYREWTWKDLGLRIGGPNMIILPDGRIVAAFRRYGFEPWTSLNWLDPDASRVTEFLELPSGGDTSYPGLSWHDGILWVSYYSSHEERTSIYLAKVAL